MSFLDRKERVLDIQLTNYGKFLLSRGKFKPEFYAFFDDDVLYDSQFADYEENQNVIEDRIIKETPILEAQSVFSGRETEVTKLNELVRSGQAELGDDVLQPESEKTYALSSPLGTMRLDTDKVPAWSIDVLKGEISGAVEFKTGSHPNVRIPQLAIKDVEFKTFVDVGLPGEEPTAGMGETIERFEDGSFLRIYEDSLLLEVNEDNTFFQQENFDVEVYEITEDSDGSEVLSQLYFRREVPEVVNDLLVDEEDRQQELIESTPAFADYFIDVLVDREIDPELLCVSVPEERRSDPYNRAIFKCPDRVRATKRTIYERTDEFVEECE